MASLTSVAICNLALTHVGRSTAPIESLTERSTEARLCNTWYDVCRREVLESLDWSFARKRLTLALHSEDPPLEWGFRYQVPSDCLAFRHIWNPLGPTADAIPYEKETDGTGEQVTILTNMEYAEGIFTRDVSLTDMFTPLFATALSFSLASRLAMPFTGKPQIAQFQQQNFSRAMALAAAADANQHRELQPRQASWIDARA